MLMGMWRCAQTLSAKRFESGRILVDNEAEPGLTVVTINERKDSTAALLDVASAMTGIGVLIHEAIIQVLLPRLPMDTRNRVQTYAENGKSQRAMHSRPRDALYFQDHPTCALDSFAWNSRAWLSPYAVLSCSCGSVPTHA